MERLVNICNPSFDLFTQVIQDNMENEKYLDTRIICSDSQTLVLPKLMVGILFPELKNCLQFHIFAKNCIFAPDYSLVEIKSLVCNLSFTGEEDSHADDTARDEESELESKICDQQQQTKDPSPLLEILFENSSSTQESNSDGNKGKSRRKKRFYQGKVFSGEYPYKCSYCCKRFKQVGHVNHHERSHTGNYKYECGECNKKFHQKSHLTEHQNLHRGEKPHQCQECMKKFTFSSGLKAHLKIHSGGKQHQCSVCDRTFSQASNLKTHMRLHTGELSFMCSECGKCFNTKINLQRHHCKVSRLESQPLTGFQMPLQEASGVDQNVYMNPGHDHTVTF